MNNDPIPTIGEWYHSLPNWKQLIFNLLCLTPMTEKLALFYWYGYSKKHWKKRETRAESSTNTEREGKEL